MLEWAVFQIGGREHYSIPRALLKSGKAVSLTTDVWVRPALSRCVPKSWKSRWHAELANIPVTSWNLSAAIFEASQRVISSNMWQRCIDRNKWFGQRAASALRSWLKSSESRPIVFAYSYAAKEIFEVAKSFGCQCVLGQIDPGIAELQLVQELARQHGQVPEEAPPESYWDDWRIECGLADRIVVNSNWSGELLNRNTQFNDAFSQKIRTIPLAFEKSCDGAVSCLKGYPERFSQDRPLRILFLGQVILRKGVAELIEAIGLLKDHPIRWTVIGTGSAQLMDQLARCPNTDVLGGVSRQEVDCWYLDSDLFILPTHSDGYAITQLEAAAFGLPIIASHYCGEVVQDGVTGIVLERVTSNEIVQAVMRILSDSKMLDSMRAAQLAQSKNTLADLTENLRRLQLEIQKPPAKN